MGWRQSNEWWPRPSRWTIILLFAGSAVAFWLLCTGGEVLWP